MSLKKLKTNNFYAIKSKEVEFSPQVTTIVGKSAAGKSSFIRSLKWIALNKPTGLRFIHWGTKQASTALKVSKKPTITRTRSKSDNLYQLGKKDFRSFKNDVPKDIADVLNIGELNFQSQHAPHFWFSLTSGEVARELNKIINLEIIDVASSRIASKVRETKATITVIENRLSNLQQQKEQLRWVKSLDKVLQRVEKLEKRTKRIPDIVWVILWFGYILGWTMLTYEVSPYNKFNGLFFVGGIALITGITIWAKAWFRKRNKDK